jgi:antitoxin VapB
MGLSIKSPEAEALARQVSALTGEGLTAAITNALRERLERLERRKHRSLPDQLDAIARRCASLPDLDARPSDEIIGYDEHGIPR